MVLNVRLGSADGGDASRPSTSGPLPRVARVASARLATARHERTDCRPAQQVDFFLVPQSVLRAVLCKEAMHIVRRHVPRVCRKDSSSAALAPAELRTAARVVIAESVLHACHRHAPQHMQAGITYSLQPPSHTRTRTHSAPPPLCGFRIDFHAPRSQPDRTPFRSRISPHLMRPTRARRLTPLAGAYAAPSAAASRGPCRSRP